MCQMQKGMVCGVRELGAGGRDWPRGLVHSKVRGSDGAETGQAGKTLQAVPRDSGGLRAQGFTDSLNLLEGRQRVGDWPLHPRTHQAY